MVWFPCCSASSALSWVSVLSHQERDLIFCTFCCLHYWPTWYPGFYCPKWAVRGASWLFLIKVLQNAQLCLEGFAVRWLQLSLTFNVIYLVSSHQGSQSAKELFLLGWLTWGSVSLRWGCKLVEGLLWQRELGRDEAAKSWLVWNEF